MFLENILLKRGWRQDGIWTLPAAYKSFLSYIPLFFDTSALMRSQYWPREQLRSLQEKRLASLFADAQNIPFWRELFVSAGISASMSPWQMLAKLPITSKKELTQRAFSDIADASLLARSDADHTSGSTGKPFHFYQDWKASVRSYAITERIFRTFTPGKRLPIVYMRSRPRNGFTFHKHTWFFLRGYTSIRYRLDDIQKLDRFTEGFVLYGYTSWILELARQMEKNHMQLPIRAVVVAGEHIADSDRAYIERVTRTKLSVLYASRETGFLGFECEHRKIHINEEWAYVETIGTNGMPCQDGEEGRIIISTFDNRVMPFIRYDIGDVGIISAVPCACGRTLRTMDFKGRAAELIELEDDRIVPLLDVSYAIGMHRDAVRQYQIVQKSKKHLLIKIVPGPLFESKKQYLEPLLIRLLHPRVQIEWQAVGSIPEAPSGKAVYFIRDLS